MKRADFVGSACSDICNATGIPGQVTNKSRESQEWRSEVKQAGKCGCLSSWHSSCSQESEPDRGLPG